MAATGHEHGLRIRVFGDLASLEWRHEDPHHLRVRGIDGGTTVLAHAQFLQFSSIIPSSAFRFLSTVHLFTFLLYSHGGTPALRVPPYIGVNLRAFDEN